MKKYESRLCNEMDILQYLSKNPASVKEISEELGLRKKEVKAYLKDLEGLVQKERNGIRNVYNLTESGRNYLIHNIFGNNSELSFKVEIAEYAGSADIVIPLSDISEEELGILGRIMPVEEKDTILGAYVIYSHQ